METPSITLDLLSVVHRPVAGATFVSSAPVWHDKLTMKRENTINSWVKDGKHIRPAECRDQPQETAQVNLVLIRAYHHL